MGSKSRNKTNRIHKEREDSRWWDEDPEEEIHEPFSNPTLADFIHGTDHLSGTLRRRFVEQGITHDWLLDRTLIYQRGIVNLAKILYETEIPDYLRNGALKELMTISEGLTR